MSEHGPLRCAQGDRRERADYPTAALSRSSLPRISFTCGCNSGSASAQSSTNFDTAPWPSCSRPYPRRSRRATDGHAGASGRPGRERIGVARTSRSTHRRVGPARGLVGAPHLHQGVAVLHRLPGVRLTKERERLVPLALGQRDVGSEKARGRWGRARSASDPDRSRRARAGSAPGMPMPLRAGPALPSPLVRRHGVDRLPNQSAVDGGATCGSVSSPGGVEGGIEGKCQPARRGRDGSHHSIRAQGRPAKPLAPTAVEVGHRRGPTAARTACRTPGPRAQVARPCCPLGPPLAPRGDPLGLPEITAARQPGLEGDDGGVEPAGPAVADLLLHQVEKRPAEAPGHCHRLAIQHLGPLVVALWPYTTAALLSALSVVESSRIASS